MWYLHPASQRRIAHYIASPAQSALLIGDAGIGFSGAFQLIAEQFGAVPYIVRPEKGTITAETIRSLYSLTQGRSRTRQLVIIDDADTMSSTAQNAFLKLLEEPTPSTYFLLASHTPTRLLPTIHSRVTPLKMTPITSEQSQALLDEMGISDDMKRQQLIFIAEGLPSLLVTLAQDEVLFQARAQQVRDARTLLQGSTYAKLQVINGYKDRIAALTLLSDSGRLVRHSTAQLNASSALRRLDAFMKSYEHIEANGNIRLWLTMAVV